ncbi:MAG: L-threonylcarbamoyladenylate synthase [Desulfobacterales bacterium]
MIKKPESLKIIRVDPLHLRHDPIQRAYRTIRAGGVIIFPTQFLYGLGADALNVQAVDRIFEIKKRSLRKPIPILIEQQEDLSRLVQQIPFSARSIMNAFWPGAVTIVFDAKDTLPANLTAGTHKIGIRMPHHLVALALTKAVGGPVTATSANITGDSGCSTISDISPGITGQVDLILDAGALKGGLGSTVVDVTVDPPKIIREGAVRAVDIFTALKTRTLR